MAAVDARCGARASCSRSSSFNGAALRAAAPRPVAPVRAGFFVEAAATKAIKAETLQRIGGMLNPSTVFVAGVNFKGMTASALPRL